MRNPELKDFAVLTKDDKLVKLISGVYLVSVTGKNTCVLKSLEEIVTVDTSMYKVIEINTEEKGEKDV